MTKQSTIMQVSLANAVDIIKTIEIPSCPDVVTEVLKLAQDEFPDFKKLVQIISNDVATSAAVLKMANSPLFRSGGVVNISQALNIIGFKNAVTIVSSVALKKAGKGLPSKFLDSFWRQASLSALSISLIARSSKAASPDLAYTFGLFRDAAVPIMMLKFKDYTSSIIKLAQKNKLTLTQQEDDLYHCSHTTVGSLIVKTWGLPLEVSWAIRAHHDDDALSDSRDLHQSAKILVALSWISSYLLSAIQEEENFEISTSDYRTALDFLKISPEKEEELHSLTLSALQVKLD